MLCGECDLARGSSCSCADPAYNLMAARGQVGDVYLLGNGRDSLGLMNDRETHLYN